MFETLGGARTNFSELAAGLDGIEPAELDVAGVEATVACIADARRWLDALEVGCVARADALAERGLGAGASGTLVTAGRSTSRDAARARDRARTVADAPELGDALATGDIDAAHIDAVARAAGRLDDEARHTMLGDAAALAQEAARMPPDSFENRCRQRATEAEGAAGLAKRLDQQRRNTNLRKGTNSATGMFWISGDWDPLTGERLDSCIEAQSRIMARELGRPFGPNLAAQALAALVFRGAKRAGIDSGPPVQPAPAEPDDTAEALSEGAPKADCASDDATTGERPFELVTAPGDEPLAVFTSLATLTRATGACETERGTHVPIGTVSLLPITGVTMLFRNRHGVVRAGHRYRALKQPRATRSPADQPGDPPIELLVLIDEPSAVDDPSPGPDALTSLLTDKLGIRVGRATPIVLDAERSIRVANRAQRHALRAMYPTCAIHGCSVAFHHCQIHHLRHWEQQGPTNLDNLIPLCSAHHHLVHDRSWTLTLDQQRRLTTTRPDGRIHSISHLPNATNAPLRRGSTDAASLVVYPAMASRTSTASSARSTGTRR